MPAARPTPRDERRRRLGQNFLRSRAAERFISGIDVRPRDLVVDIGAGSGALTRALSRRGAEVIAVEVDPDWAAELRTTARRMGDGRVHVTEGDVLRVRLPNRPFRVVGCLPFGATTAILRRLFDNPATPLRRADLIVQWEVARKRAVSPPTTLLSSTWAPWWEFELGERIPARDFRPVPSVDGGVLEVSRRTPPILPAAMSKAFVAFVRDGWPFESSRAKGRQEGPRS